MIRAQKNQKPHPATGARHRDMLRQPWVLLCAVTLGLSAIWMIWTYPTVVPDSDAGFYLIQKAEGYSRSTGSVSATFRREPKAGNLIVGVLSSKDPVTYEATEGWISAVNALDQSPGQAVFYRTAPGDGQKSFGFSGFPERSIMQVQLFEFRGFDAYQPIVSVLSAQGFGETFALGASEAWDSRTLVLTAISATSRLTVESWEPSEAVELTDQQMPFGGALTSAAAQVFGADNGAVAIGGYLSKPANWLAHAVVFRVPAEAIGASGAEDASDISVTIVSTTLEPKIYLPMTYTVTVKNDGPETATNVDIDHRIASALHLRKATASSGEYLQRSGVWSVPSLAPGDVATLTVEAVVDEESVHASFLNTAAVVYLDQLDLDLNDNQAAFMTTPRRPKRAQIDALVDCPQITGASLAIEGGAETSPSRDVTLMLSAKNATYVLIAEGDDIMQAAMYPVRGTMQYLVRDPRETATLYAWFGNECDQASVVYDGIAFVGSALGELADAPDSLADAGDLTAQTEGLSSADCEFASDFSAFLSIGSKGEDVVMLQDFLKCTGYLAEDFETDGSFGLETQTAVKAFQADHGIAQVGATGPVTRNAINAYFD